MRELMLFFTAQREMVATVFFAALSGWLLWRERAERKLHELRRELDQMELDAYGALEGNFPTERETHSYMKEVCRTVTSRSRFAEAAILLPRDEDGVLQVAASSGMEEREVQALQDWSADLAAAGPYSWAERLNGEQHGAGGGEPRGSRIFPLPAVTALQISLRQEMRREVLDGSQDVLEDSAEDSAKDSQALESFLVLPFWSMSGRVLGALVVGARRVKGYGRSCRRELAEVKTAANTAGVEMLALKLGRRIETATLADRLMKAERMASLGQLAGGVAHALNNPLTAVVGFAELISEMAEQPRIQQDAETIRTEALRMRDTVQSLLNFFRPGIARQEPIHLPDLLQELAVECEEKLRGRDVALIIESEREVPKVLANRDRIRQVLEHLLNNCAQAIAVAQTRAAQLEGQTAAAPHQIRVTISHDRGLLQLIVSDTGTGFREPARVFDPYQTAQQAGQGAGLGLSICYGIVREHRGEISAFNLHPRGAAVIIELPVLAPVQVERITHPSQDGVEIRGAMVERLPAEE